MALINCTECGKEISEKAESCPGCGNPINAKTKEVKRAGGIYEATGFVLIIIGICLMIAGYGGGGGILFTIGFVVFIIGRMK